MSKLVLDSIVVVLLSYGGFKVFARFNFPAPKVFGPMLFVLVGNLMGLNFQLPDIFNTVLTIGVGIIVGLQFHVKIDRKLIGLLVFSCCWMIFTGLGIGKILTLLGVQKDIALFSAMPGGITELTFISSMMVSDPFVVALLHATRMITLLIAVPAIVSKFPKGEAPIADSKKELDAERKPLLWYDWPVLVLLAAIAGIGLTFLHVPVGAFIGSLVATALYSIKRRGVSLAMNPHVRDVLETCVGGVVGTKMTLASVKMIPSLLIPILVLDGLILGSSLLLGKVLNHISDMDKPTSYLASAPGGFSPFVIIAGQMNANTSRVAVFHLCRYLSMIIFALIQFFL
ncbi:AbrB family transcriptional regulator [Lachnospiraceae bacterium ZAX-1]